MFSSFNFFKPNFQSKLILLFVILSFLFEMIPAFPQEENIGDKKQDTQIEQEQPLEMPETNDSKEEFEVKEEPKFKNATDEQIEQTQVKGQELQKLKDIGTKVESSTLLKGHVSKVPGGTRLKVILETPIDETTTMIDDEITARVSENVLVDGETVIPAGTVVIGKVSEISPAKRLHKSGTVRIEFKNLSLPNQREVPIVATVLTHSGLIKGKYSKKTALISTATILGPVAAGVGAGLAAEGSAIGAGLGAGLGLLAGIGLFAFEKGNMIDLMSGDELNIELVEEALVPSGREEIEKKYCEIKARK